LKRIPLRICVTGTRGKSSVTRLIASILREAGFSVFAKTTGSKPTFLFPDGKEEVIIRKGIPSIMEQRRMVKIAAKLGVEALVLEMMSINPESMFTESNRLLQPNVMVVTNIRKDHREHWGNSLEHIARCFGASIPEGCIVFIPKEEVSPVFRESNQHVNSKIIAVSEDKGVSQIDDWMIESGSEFGQNLRLAMAVTDFFKINPKRVKEGITKAFPDVGGLRVWSISPYPSSDAWYFVSAFAANDPESTRKVLDKLREKDWWEEKEIIGLLNLRKDRGDRTCQWIEALQQDTFPGLNKLVLLGSHARIMKRRIQQESSRLPVLVFKQKAAEKITEALWEIQTRPAVVIGMGNMQGGGEALVHYWKQKGKAHVL
jgi:poly-gamma-glutamate synthase PgsB/CapB